MRFRSAGAVGVVGVVGVVDVVGAVDVVGGVDVTEGSAEEAKCYFGELCSETAERRPRLLQHPPAPSLGVVGQPAQA